MSRSQPALIALAALIVAMPPTTGGASEGPIQDNSFLIEEAYNQEAGVIQHISTLNRSVQTGEWVYSFTEEWPVLGQTHQASITLNLAALQGPGSAGVGDVVLNYRWQVVGSGDAPIAIAPRLSAILPTGDAARGFGVGGPGLQVNVPISTVLSEQFVAHTNIGGTYVPSARAAGGGRGPFTLFTAGQSLIWLATRNLNFLVEALYATSEAAGPVGVERRTALIINPGVRAAFNLSNGLQIVPGVSVPIGVGPSRGEQAVFFYLSFEHPFWIAGQTTELQAARLSSSPDSDPAL